MSTEQAETAVGPETTATDRTPADGPAQSYNQAMVHDIGVTFAGGAQIANAVFGVQTTGDKQSLHLTTSTGLVTEDDLAGARSRFVQPAGFVESTTRLAGDRLLVLCGAQGIGKRSSALSLLREVTDKTLYMLSPHISLTELAEHDYETGCGYLVVDRVVDQSHQESDFDWRVVRDRVRTKNCYLVVTRPMPLRTGDESLGHVSWQPPSAERVLRAYWPAEWPAECEEALSEALASTDLVRDVVGLARRLDSGKSWDVAIEHLDVQVRAKVAEWFDASPDRRRILEVTTLTFTVGVDERTFEAALLRLKRTLHRYIPEPAAEDGGAKEDSLQLRGRLLDNSLVDIEIMHTDLGSKAALRYAKPEYRRHVLAQLWRRMDVAFWDAVGEWLDEIVVRPRYEVCVGVGLAEFASVALDEVLAVLDRWAQGSCAAAGQRSAVYALYTMAYDESLAPIALQIATGWITRGKPAHRWVAAMALAGKLGVRYPHDARRRLWQVCVQSHTVDGNVEQVFGELFATLARDTENAHLVLTFLAEKVERFTRSGAKPGMRSVAVRTALAVLEAKDVVTKRSSVLTYLADFPDRTELFAELLASLLVHRPVRLRAIGGLRELLEDLVKNDDHAMERAKRLGDALRIALPVHEHEPLESHLRVAATRKKDTNIRSLVDVILDALSGRAL